MGHFCKVGNRHPAAYVPSESHRQRRFRSAEFLRIYKLLYAYNVHVAVRNLYTHRRLVGNGCFYSDAPRRKVQGYIVRKSRYFADFHPCAGLKLISGNGGTPAYVYNSCLHAEALQGVHEQIRIVAKLLGYVRGIYMGNVLEQVHRGECVGRNFNVVHKLGYALLLRRGDFPVKLLFLLGVCGIGLHGAVYQRLKLRVVLRVLHLLLGGLCVFHFFLYCGGFSVRILLFRRGFEAVYHTVKLILRHFALRGLFRRRFEAVYNAVKLVLRQRSFLHGRHLEAVNGLRRGDSIFLRRRNCGDSRFLPRKRHIYVGTGCAALPALFAEELFLAAANRRSGGFVLILHLLAVEGYVYLNILPAGCVRRTVLLHLFVVNILDLFTGFFCSVGNSPEGGSGDEHEHRRNKHKLHYYSRRSAHKRKPGNAEHYGKHAAAHKLLAVVIELPYFGEHSAGKLHAVRKNGGYAAEQQHKGKTLPALRRSGKGWALHGVHHRKVDENRAYEVCTPSEKPEYRVMQPLPKVLSPHEGKRREYNAQCKEQNRIELPLIGAFLRLFRGLGILFTLSCLFFCHLYILSKKSFGFCRL